MKFLLSPTVRLLAVTVTVAVGLRHVFLMMSHWIWHFAADVKMAEIVPWARWAMESRDGIEPYALVVVVLLEWVLTALGVAVLARLAPRWRAAAVVALLAVAVRFPTRVPLRPPLAAVDLMLPSVLKLVVACLLATLLLQLAMRRRFVVPATLAIVLLPLCFVRTTLPSLVNMVTILSPALRLQRGFAPSQIFLQYDLFPSLLALAWSEVGGPPIAFGVAVAAVYYAALLGVFLLARRVFRRSELAAPLLVSILLVRFYAVMGDPLLCPQVTPMRLDVWVLLLLAARAKGLRHWFVGLAMACVCFFWRSIGTIYLGAYFLALAADFLAERRCTPRTARAPFWQDARAMVVSTAPALGLVALSFVAARLVFGGFGSDALALYRQLGVGMLPIEPKSFYWWLLALTGAVGWLAFSLRGALPARLGQTAIFAVALLLASSIYFFGRSHEHNLINTSAAFLFCAFLGLDLGWPAADEGSRAVRASFRLAPWLIVAVCAYFYSGRVLEKLKVQALQVMTQRIVPPSEVGDVVPDIDCGEIRKVADDGRAYFFSKDDFWYYERCAYAPQGYVQPMALSVLEKPLVKELQRLLDGGYKIFVPRRRGDFAASAFPVFLPALPGLDVVQTPNFQVYLRHGPVAK